ncbi:MAG TPA: VOC family protein [Candidatus Polarisedimenticolia bacterium]|jgi:catechol 2,3-dioxygenase-like lactoylglutathione lyase family enzyme
MFDHVSLKVKDGERSRKFFKAALGPLGYKLLEEYDGGGGFGTGETPSLWIAQGQPHAPGVHLAFASPDRASVDAFHAAALKTGGRDNGAPGIRKNYGPHYYAAFVLDPDGNNIEAVFNRAASR